ncbi:MAG: hypothetical protein HUJ68_08475 [Clostridia bacterium]|nr:hypothetical protein [Clostridia bacterium]
MNTIRKGIINLLQNRIKINDYTLPVIAPGNITDKTPCITITQTDENMVERRYTGNTTINVFIKYNADVYINIWCNSDTDRHNIIKQIREIFFQAIGNHYSTCTNYNNGACQYLEQDCKALTEINGRTAKKQCPQPKDYHYESFFKRNNIYKNTFKIQGETDGDDLNLKPPIYHSIIKINCDYYVEHEIGGHEPEEFIIEGL